MLAPATHEWFVKLMAAAQAVPIVKRIVACRDARDDRFLELAVNNGHADIIVSGDADLLVLSPFRGIPIVQPADFLERVTR